MYLVSVNEQTLEQHACSFLGMQPALCSKRALHYSLDFVQPQAYNQSLMSQSLIVWLLIP
jgi:hypothetical protein